jgi:RimJ/RimL family protein N-acetyltransferase
LFWRNDPNVRQFSKSSQVIDEMGHASWLKMRLSKLQNEPLFVFISESRPAGTARLDKFSESENSFEVSILIDPEFQGLGKARILLDLVINYALEKFGASRIIAYIHCENIKSIKLFQSLDFSYLNKDQNFLKFEKILIS